MHALQACGKHVSLYAITYETLLLVSSFIFDFCFILVNSGKRKKKIENVRSQKVPYKVNTTRYMRSESSEEEEEEKLTIIM